MSHIKFESNSLHFLLLHYILVFFADNKRASNRVQCLFSEYVGIVRFCPESTKVKIFIM